MGMRFIVTIVIVTLAGCNAPADYRPYAAAVMGRYREAQPVPQPDATCTNCNGNGYVGDGTVRVDCPECETEWEAAAPRTEVLQPAAVIVDDNEAPRRVRVRRQRGRLLRAISRRR